MGRLQAVLLGLGIVVGCFPGSGVVESLGAEQDAAPGTRGKGTPARGGVEIRIDDRAIIVTTEDPDVELTVRRGGQSVRIVDLKTGQEAEVDIADFRVLLGSGENSVRLSGDQLTLARGGKDIVEIRRAGQPPPPRPAAPAPPPAAGEVRRFEGHEAPVVGVAFSPDGRRAVSGSWDRTVRVWDVDTGQELRRLEESAGVSAVTFAPDGRRVLVGTPGGIAHLRDIETGREVRQFLHENAVDAVAISPTGDRILTGGYRGIVRFWDVDSGIEIGTFEQPMDLVKSLAFSPDGRRALCAGGYHNNSDTPLDALVRVWDLDTGKTVFAFKPPVRTVIHEAAFSPDGRLVLAEDVADRRQLALWDMDTGEKVRTFPENTYIQSVAFSPDGRRVLSAGTNGTLTLADAQSGHLIARFAGHQRGVSSVALSPDGLYALSGGPDRTVRLWRLPGPQAQEARKRPGAEVRRLEHQGPVYSVAFSPDGRRALTCGFDRALCLWDVESGRRLQQFVGDKAWHIVNDLAWSPDGRYALLGAGQYRETGRVTLWDIEAWREVRTFEERGEIVTCVAFSPDGRRALSGNVEGEVRVWDVQTGRQIGAYKPPLRGARSVAFSPDGRLAVYAGGFGDPRVRVWEVESGREVCLLGGHSQNVVRAVFAPDSNSRILSAGGDRTIRFWDLTDGLLQCITVSEAVTSVAFSPDGRRALSGGVTGQIRLWDLQTGQEVQSLEGHTQRVTDVACSPDGRYALSGSSDWTARLWRLQQSAGADAD